MTTRTITTTQTADLAIAYAAAISKCLARPTVKTQRSVDVARALFNASRAEDLLAAVRIECALIA